MELEKKPMSTLIIPVDNELNIETQEGQVVVSSRAVAQRFNKIHDHVVRDIENIKSSEVTQNWGDL